MGLIGSQSIAVRGIDFNICDNQVLPPRGSLNMNKLSEAVKFFIEENILIHGYCIFWDKLCTIHPVKPLMCRQWPFLKSVLVDSKNWQIMAGACPGIHPNVPVRTLEKCIQIILSQK